MVDASDLKSGGSNIVRVRFPPSAQIMTNSMIEIHPPNQSEIEKILALENYIVFPNKYTHAPLLDPHELESIFHESSAIMQQVLEILSHYLLGIAAGDDFGSDHTARRKKLKELEKKYGSVYYDGIENRNKFRTNLMAVILPIISGRITRFAIKAGHSQLAEQLSTIIQESKSKLGQFPPYERIDSLDTKYEIICILDDTIVLVFETIASYYETQTNLTNQNLDIEY